MPYQPKLMKNRLLLPAFVAGAVAVAQANVWADTAANIEAGLDPNPVNYDGGALLYGLSYPVVTAVLTAPVGALDGYTYKNYAFLAQDTTGSLDVFYSSTASSYVPTVGDGISVTGTYAPFDAIPELGTPTLS